MPDDADDTPVLDTIMEMTAASLDHTTLDPATLMRLRLGALVAIDAPPASYLLNGQAAGEVDLTVEDMQEVLIAVAPIVGTARVTAAVGNIARAYGFAIALSDAEVDFTESTPTTQKSGAKSR